MRGDDHGHAVLAQLAQQRQHLADQLGVERRRHLVEEQQRRPVDQGPGDGHPLLLAAGELVGVHRGLLRQADAGEHLARPGLRLGARHAVHPLGGEGDVVEHR